MYVRTSTYALVCVCAHIYTVIYTRVAGNRDVVRCLYGKTTCHAVSWYLAPQDSSGPRGPTILPNAHLRFHRSTCTCRKRMAGFQRISRRSQGVAWVVRKNWQPPRGLINGCSRNGLQVPCHTIVGHVQLRSTRRSSSTREAPQRLLQHWQS